jgi:hypothetical protein
MFWQIKSLIVPFCTKIKPGDIIRFLIGQFDLIMGRIKNSIMFKN